MKTKLITGGIIGILILAAAFFLIINSAVFKNQMTQKKAALQKNSEKVHTSYGDLEYSTTGSGDPVIVIHGAGGGWDQGLLLADIFSPDSKLIAVSRPGFLGTPLTEQNASPEIHAVMYSELVDTLGLGSVHVLAFSDGGPSALLFAQNHPEQCKTLTMCAAKSKSPPPETPLQKLVFGNIFKFDFVFWFTEKYFRSSLLAMFGVTEDVQETMQPSELALIENFLAAMQPMNLRIDGILNERKQLAHLSPLLDTISSISVPTLVIHAKDDTLQHYDYALHTAESIPDAKLITYTTGGHMLIGHHDELSRLYRAFITN